MKTENVNLVGLWFHSWTEDETLEWQGQVIGLENPEGYYLVQLYEWVSGKASVIRLQTLNEMVGWGFFKSAEEMKEAYEHYSKKQKGS